MCGHDLDAALRTRSDVCSCICAYTPVCISQEFDMVVDASLTPKERLEKQRKQLKKKLGERMQQRGEEGGSVWSCQSST